VRQGQVAQVRGERRALEVRQHAGHGRATVGVDGAPKRPVRPHEHRARYEQLGNVDVERRLRRRAFSHFRRRRSGDAAAKTAADAGDFDTAIASLNEATQMDATRDLLWFKLGDYYRMSATKQTDPAEKQKRLASAVESYQKAIDIKKSATNDKDPNAAKNLAAYYNNLAEAYAKSNKMDDAVKTYELAAQADPTSAAQYYFNTGAVLTNAGKVDDAIVAFDKVISLDPNRADAYYWKGVNLIGKATLQGEKMVAPQGTAEAFQKYLELQPSGTYADAAKQMLTSIGSSVETTFGKKKQAPKK